MADEITTTRELLDLTELSDVVIHYLEGERHDPDDREDEEPRLSPEPLESGDDPLDDIVSFAVTTRVDGDEIGVRCRIITFNYHGSFTVDGEAIFSFEAPTRPIPPDIVHDFVEQVGVMALYPYLRAASAACAAQMSLPTPRFPLLRAGDLKLWREDERTPDDEPPLEEGEEHLGAFATKEEAMLAVEMHDALRGGREPVQWLHQVFTGEPAPGYVYTIYDGPPFKVAFEGPEEQSRVWPEDFDTLEAAQEACEADWDRRQPRE